MGKGLLVVVPVLNEGRHIEAVLDFLDADISESNATVVVADGGSEDKTAEIVSGYMPKNCSLVLLNNVQKIQASGINEAVRLYSEGKDVLVRIDAHSKYPPGFIQKVTQPIRDGICSSVVVSMETLGGNAFQDAQRALFNSPIGNGGSAHRKVDAVSTFVNHGHHAAFNIEAFCRVGMYNESLAANEDAELDRRFVKGGHKILLNGEATIGYYPRENPVSLAKQYFRNGKFRVLSSQIDGSVLGGRQLIPVLALLSFMLFFVGVACFFYGLPFLGGTLISPFLGYMLLVSTGSVIYMRDASTSRLPLFIVAAIVSHWSFGFGVLKTILRKG